MSPERQAEYVNNLRQNDGDATACWRNVSLIKLDMIKLQHWTSVGLYLNTKNCSASLVLLSQRETFTKKLRTAQPKLNLPCRKLIIRLEVEPLSHLFWSKRKQEYELCQGENEFPTYNSSYTCSFANVSVKFGMHHKHCKAVAVLQVEACK